MLQIVHDVAPAASLAFATSEGGQASVANNILALRANGANVLVDDVIYLAEPMFQDGIIAQAVDTVVRQGAAYFSAAGNEARLSYESVFRPGTVFMNGAIPSAPGAPHFFGGTAHNFASSGPEDNCQNITIPAQSSFAPDLQWDSPFFSVSGGRIAERPRRLPHGRRLHAGARRLYRHQHGQGPTRILQVHEQ